MSYFLQTNFKQLSIFKEPILVLPKIFLLVTKVHFVVGGWIKKECGSKLADSKQDKHSGILRLIGRAYLPKKSQSAEAPAKPRQ